MIGHWLLTLTLQQEHRVLTQPFERLLESCESRPLAGLQGCRCLVLTATDGAAMFGPIWNNDPYIAPGYRYEFLCQRFGELRINAAIRNRILANQARRVLAAVRTPQQAPA